MGIFSAFKAKNRYRKDVFEYARVVFFKVAEFGGNVDPAKMFSQEPPEAHRKQIYEEWTELFDLHKTEFQRWSKIYNSTAEDKGSALMQSVAYLQHIRETHKPNLETDMAAVMSSITSFREVALSAINDGRDKVFIEQVNEALKASDESLARWAVINSLLVAFRKKWLPTCA